MSDEAQERCDSCGQLFMVMRSSVTDVRPSTTRCADCVAHSSASTATQTHRRAPAAAAGDSFRIHSLVGDTAPPPTDRRPNASRNSAASSTRNSSSSQPPFLVHAAAAHAQYYALAASGLLPAAVSYSGRSVPLDWTPPAGLTAKHRYGV